MAERRPLHQQFPFRSGLETAGKPFNPPLLPYELSLIEAIGCSEEEYKEFVRHAMLRQRVRPAEYDHIPDVVNEPVTTTTFLVQLAIGLVLTGASMLLAPKAPTDPGSKIKGKKLADQIGPSRFNQTTNFDNVASLAELNQPIPIPFGKRGTGADGNLTGGLILVPALVWSRLYAYGAYQAYEGVYVAGEFGVDEPDLGGILLGTSALNSLSQPDFALYWSSSSGSNRPTSLLYGTEGSGATGTVGRQVFTSPTDDGQFSQGFSMAYTPSGDTTFGTSTPIHNGSAYRFNWEIISAPFSTTEGRDNRDARREIQAKRRKIAGSLADVLHEANEEAGQPGVGRAYSRHMGIISHSGTQGGAEQKNKQIVNVAVGDTVNFEINNDNEVWKELEKDDFDDTEVNLKDLINSAKSWRERASDLLVVGSKWIISASNWVVIKRVKEGKRVLITLECVAIIGVPEIGIAGTRAVREPLGGYEGDQFARLKHCGAAFYNVCRLSTATIRPVRRDAEVIELGIRSQVWNKASGLCNFNAIPSPTKLFKLDEDDIQVSTPRMDKYFLRSSCFSVFVRPVKEYGQEQAPYVRIPKVFCVQGSAPINQNNFLRIRPRVKGFYEYKIFPRTGSDIAINSLDENTVIVLDSNEGVPYTGSALAESDYETPYGGFRITTQGRLVPISEIRSNEELFTNPGDQEGTLNPNNIPTAIDNINVFSNTGSPWLIKQAFYTELFGLAVDNENDEQTETEQISVGGRSITIQFKATSRRGILGENVGPKYVEANSDSKYLWQDVQFNVVDANGNWTVGERFSLTQNLNNRFSRYAEREEGQPYSSVTFEFVVSAVGAEATGQLRKGDRVFELNSQVSDCSHYTELTKSNDSGPEHEVVYVNEYISNETPANYDAMSTIGFTVKSSGEINGVEQLRMWSATGIPVTRLIEGDNKPSNLFADLVFYLLTNKTQGVGNIVPSELVDEDSLRTTAKFLRANKIFFDSVIEDSESFRGFLYENASLQLCNFTIKNGKFGMQPALPFDSNHEISLAPIQVDQIFTAGNIIQDSLQLQYIDVSQRTNIRAIVSWRVTVQNDLPYQASALMHWSDIPINDRATTEQAFDLSEFCTNREQALKTARFLLSTRRRITKTVSFQTVPDALSVQPGSYIRVITEASTYSSTANGAITDAGTLVSITSVKDGTYDALIYKPSTSKVLETKLTISGNSISESEFHGSFFTLLSGSTDYSVYQVESLNLEEDGLVSINAVEVPTDASGVSIVAKDVLTPGNFTVLE
mgnify:CR=1 FL=1|jgi:hypothetical protein|tara:strand:- start:1315 stop:5127 length:3813 start_codon:yes stop_codon:yes gene_type:complete